MKKFDFDINNKSQKKIRKAFNLPLDNDSAGLAWFSSKKVTPSNNISITDLSNFILENSYSSDSSSSFNRPKSKLVYSNELGILEDEMGETVFDSDDISISDMFLSRTIF